MTSEIPDVFFMGDHISVIVTDTDGYVLFSNSGTEAILGNRNDKTCRMHMVDILDGCHEHDGLNAMVMDDATSMKQRFNALVFNARRGIEDPVELEYIKEDGSRQSVVASISLLYDKGNAAIGFVFISTVNYAFQQVESNTGNFNRYISERQYYTRSLIESNLDAMIVTDQSGIITDVNRQMEKISGRSRYELIGTSFDKHFANTIQASSTIDIVMKNIRVTDYELKVQSADGHVTTLSCNATIISDRNGHPLGMLVDARDVTQLKDRERQIIELAYHDSLTRLANRRLLADRLAQAMAVSKRSGRYGALIFLDLDRFKSLNDEHGHNVGDLLLTEVSRRIVSCVREVDFVARYGGDEFVVILENMDADKTASTRQSMVVANKILVALREPYVLKTRTTDGVETDITHHCTSSIGIALFLNHVVPVEEVIRWADTAMYLAKQSGGDSVLLYDSEPEAIPEGSV